MNSEEQNSLAAKKEALSRQSELYKQAIEEQVNDIKENAGQLSKKALIIGAGVVAGYFLLKVFIKAGNKKVHVPAKTTSYDNKGYIYDSFANGHSKPLMAPAVRTEPLIVSLIKQQIAIFLIGLAKQKIQEALNHFHKENNEPVTDNETKYIEPIYIQ